MLAVVVTEAEAKPQCVDAYEKISNKLANTSGMTSDAEISFALKCEKAIKSLGPDPGPVPGSRPTPSAPTKTVTYTPQPFHVCEDIADTIQSFIDFPGSTVSSTGYMIQRHASWEDRKWLKNWNYKKSQGTAACVDDYPSKIAAVTGKMKRRQRDIEMSEQRALERDAQRQSYTYGGMYSSVGGSGSTATAPSSSPPSTISSSEAAQQARERTCNYGYQGSDSCN